MVGRFPCYIGSGALAHSLLREVEKGEGYPFWVIGTITGLSPVNRSVQVCLMAQAGSGDTARDVPVSTSPLPAGRADPTGSMPSSWEQVPQGEPTLEPPAAARETRCI